jgi:hypothetical protein
VALVMVCQTCNRVLETYTSIDRVGYRHAMQDRDGHPAVPVPMPAGYTGGRCDFCNVDHPTHVVPARDFRVPVTDTMSRGNWGACAECAELVRRNHWSALLTRVARSHERSYGVSMAPEIKRNLQALYARLQVHISGPVRPITDEETPQ